MGQSESLGILPGGYFSNLLRYHALDDLRRELEEQIPGATGERKVELVMEAIAVRARMAEIEQDPA